MTITASDIMTTGVISVRPDDTVAAAVKILTQHHISAAPVCDAGGAVVGMLSDGDLMRPFGESNVSRRDSWLGLLAEGTDLAPAFIAYVRQDQRPVRHLMTTPVITAAPEMSLEAVADLLIKKCVKRVPILRDGKMIGIVSRADVVRALAGRISSPND